MMASLFLKNGKISDKEVCRPLLQLAGIESISVHWRPAWRIWKPSGRRSSWHLVLCWHHCWSSPNWERSSSRHSMKATLPCRWRPAGSSLSKYSSWPIRPKDIDYEVPWSEARGLPRSVLPMPTDPMAVEDADIMIIIRKPMKEWITPAVVLRWLPRWRMRLNRLPIVAEINFTADPVTIQRTDDRIESGYRSQAVWRRYAGTGNQKVAKLIKEKGSGCCRCHRGSRLSGSAAARCKIRPWQGAVMDSTLRH